MTTSFKSWDIRELATLILLNADARLWPAAEALEAMAEKVDSLNYALHGWVQENAPGGWIDELRKKAQERDRLKAALETIAEGRDSGRHDGLPEEHPAHTADMMHYIACEALEGREWERFRNEKVIIGKGADQIIIDDPFRPPTEPAPAVCEWTNASGEEYRRDVAKLIEERDRLRSALERVRAMTTLELDGAEALDAMEVLRAERDRLRNEKAGTHGSPELDEDARKLAAMGQDPGAVFAAEPAPVCEWTRTPWGRAPSASPVDALYIPRCDADYLRNVPGSGMCHRCGKPIKLTEAME